MRAKPTSPVIHTGSTANLNQSAIRAMVSIFLHLIKVVPSRTNGDRLHYLLSSLHQSFAHSGFDYTELQLAVTDLIPIMDAVRIIQREFTYPEKLIFLLELLQIVYHEPEFNVLESLEVVELVDYLYIDLVHYEAILDFVEGVTEHIVLEPKVLLDDRLSIFKNCVILSANEDGDVLLPAVYGKLVLIYLAGFALLVAEQHEHLLLNEQSISPGLTIKITAGDSLILRNPATPLTLQYTQLLQLFKNKKTIIRRIYPLEIGDALLKISQLSNLVRCTVLKGRITVSGRELMPKAKATLNLLDCLCSGQESLCMTDIITGHWHRQPRHKPIPAVYLDKAEGFFRLNNRLTSHSIARLTELGTGWSIEPLKGTTARAASGELYNKQNPAIGALYLNDTLLISLTKLSLQSDILRVENDRFTITHGMEVIRVEQQVQTLEVIDLCHKFPGSSKPALNHIRFQLKEGEIMAIMGPSGSGKTTLLKTLLGEVLPEKSAILLNGVDLSSRQQYYQSRISYVPQDDLLFANLTVYDNLYYCSRLRLSGSCPGALLDYKISHILSQVGLYEKRHMVVGDALNKKLSGGERKRLNIALELVTDPQIIIMDEPTSGLSSKDSEKLMQFMLALKSQGKIIISTIHQPNPELFSHFDKLLFLDYGGTQVYFGEVSKVFGYFNEEYHQLLPLLPDLQHRKQLMMPEFIFDILEAPADEDNPERRYPPEYWEDKYKRERIVRMIQNETEVQTDHKVKTAAHSGRSVWKDALQAVHHFWWLLARNLRNKIASKANLIITFMGTPLLGLITAFVLRYAPPGSSYSFGSNENYPLYLFISVIIFIFLGIAGSIDEILSECRIILREAQLNVSMGQQLAVKSVSLSLFTLIQTCEYYVISGLILGVEGAFLPYLLYLMLAGGIGFSFGLLCSAWMKDRKAVINVLPLILIPQILFAGAVIPFAKMNSHLKLKTAAEVPEFCQLIPSRWLFEGFCTAHTDLNTWDKTINRFNREIAQTRGAARWGWMDQKAAFASVRNVQSFQNDALHRSVNIQTGNYFNHGGAPFFSRYADVRGHRWFTWRRNLAYILIYMLILHICCLFSLNSYRKKQH